MITDGEIMRRYKFAFILILIGFVVMSVIALGQETGERRPTRERWDHVAFQARVEAIDLDKREAVLRGPLGNLVTVEADESVERFNEIKVGDLVNAEFWTYIKAEFRNPTPDELKEPLVILEESGKAPKGMPPAAAVGAVIQAVVTLEIINRPDMMVTVKGPRGQYVTIPVEDPNLITQLRVGEVAVLTYAEALALSLEKVQVGD